MLTVRPRCLLQVFFECLKSENTAYSEWYRGIKSKMTRIIIQRSMVTATPTDLSAPPLSISMM